MDDNILCRMSSERKIRWEKLQTSWWLWNRSMKVINRQTNCWRPWSFICALSDQIQFTKIFLTPLLTTNIIYFLHLTHFLSSIFCLSLLIIFFFSHPILWFNHEGKLPFSFNMLKNLGLSREVERRKIF